MACPVLLTQNSLSHLTPAAAVPCLPPVPTSATGPWAQTSQLQPASLRAHGAAKPCSAPCPHSSHPSFALQPLQTDPLAQPADGDTSKLGRRWSKERLKPYSLSLTLTTRPAASINAKKRVCEPQKLEPEAESVAWKETFSLEVMAQMRHLTISYLSSNTTPDA